MLFCFISMIHRMMPLMIWMKQASRRISFGLLLAFCIDTELWVMWTGISPALKFLLVDNLSGWIDRQRYQSADISWYDSLSAHSGLLRIPSYCGRWRRVINGVPRINTTSDIDLTCLNCCDVAFILTPSRQLLSGGHYSTRDWHDI